MATWPAATAAYSDVLAAYNLASDGDTVTIPSGSATWTTALAIGNKAITLQGAGKNSTVITHNVSGSQVKLITFNAQNTPLTRITAIGFISGTYDRRFIGANLTTSSTCARIDNCKFNGVTGANNICIDIDGLGQLLIDSSDFTGGDASEMIHNNGSGVNNAPSYSGNGWDVDVTPGGANMVFVEDCTFTKNDQSGNPVFFFGTCAIQSYYGARTVFRYNTCTMAEVDQHGTAGNVGARWWEIYENTTVVVANGDIDKAINPRMGSGVIFNNHKSGRTDYKGDIVMGETGIASTYQVGKGKNGASDPAYVWGNDASFTITKDGSITEGVDYILSAKPAYTPYTYPHPLRGGGGSTMTSGLSGKATLSGKFTLG